MQTAFDIAADLDTPVSAYLKLRPFEPRFLLESVEGGERLGRYSFVGLGESLGVRLSAGEITVGNQRRAVADRGELLAALRGALDRAPRLAPELEDVPFTGGLVGATGYGVARHFERLPGSDGDGLPQAVYTAPRSLLVFDHVTRRAALLHDGPEAERSALRKEIIRALRGAIPRRKRGSRHSAPRPSIEHDRFLATVERTKKEISAGEIYQLVLSVRFDGETEMSPFEAYRGLRLLNPSPYMYFCELGDVAVVGSSPEALVRLEGRQAHLRPIAGTRPRGSDADEDRALERELLDDPKEAAEHVMLVDLARNDLGRVAVTGSVKVEPFRNVERYSHVMHLVSGVQGILGPDHDAFDLFASAFPAGTVVGAPKIRAMELIDELEPVPRGLYAGTVGYFGHGGAMDQAIAIRTLVFHQDRYSYQAGAGIVADSIPEREHDEVLAKGAALEAAMTLAEDEL
jgi:anthranilate synthase component 1